MFKEFLIDGTKPNQGALDFSEILDPVGSHGFLHGKDGKLVFDDGTTFKAFGTTLVGKGCTPEHEVAECIAKRLATSGVNMVRFHFLDSDALINYEDGSSRNLKPEGLEKLDYMVYQLEKNNIYVQLDSNVGRRWMPKGDELDYPDEFPEKWPAKEANIFNRRMIDLQKEYMTKLFTHENQYTGKRYVDDPGIAVIQIMNENSMMWDFGAYFDLEMLPPNYKRELKSKWQKWLKEKYGTNEKLREAWTDMNGVCALYDAEHLDAFVQVPTDPYYTTKVVGAEHTVPQKDVNSQPRTADYVQFLLEIEESFIKEMVEHLRSIGVKCGINTTNRILGAANLYTSSLHADVNEQDSYYNHPFLGYYPPACVTQKPMGEVDPRAMVGLNNDLNNMVTNLASAQVDGFPLIQAEWNDVNPTPFDADAYLYMTAYGSLQDWGGLMNFCYGSGETMDTLKYDDLHRYFTIYNDPAKWGQLGSAAYVFQKELIQRAKNNVYVCFTNDDIHANIDSARIVPYCTIPYVSRIAGRFSPDDKFTGGENDLIISGGYTPSGDFTEAQHAIVFSESPYKDLHHHEYGIKEHLNKHLEEGAVPYFGIGRIGEKRLVLNEDEGKKMTRDAYTYGDVVSDVMRRFGMLEKDQGIVDGKYFNSDTGELKMCPSEDTLSVETERFAAFAGKPAAVQTVGNADFEITNGVMEISMLARDEKPLAESDYILLTCIGVTKNVDMKFDGIWLTDFGHGPVLVDQIDGKCTIHGAKKSLKVYALAPDGARREELPVEFDGDDAVFKFDTEEGTIHFELRS